MIDSTNLVIGPNTRVVKGIITKLEINGEDVALAINKPDIPAIIDTETLSDGASGTLGIITDGDVSSFDDFLASVKNIWAVNSGIYEKVDFVISDDKITIDSVDYIAFD